LHDSDTDAARPFTLCAVRKALHASDFFFFAFNEVVDATLLPRTFVAARASFSVVEQARVDNPAPRIALHVGLATCVTRAGIVGCCGCGSAAAVSVEKMQAINANRRLST
jgi:hypothetical protein